MYYSDYDNPNEKPNGTLNKQTKPPDFLKDEEKVGLLLEPKTEIEMKPLNSSAATASSVDSEVIKSPLSPMPVSPIKPTTSDNE